MHDIEILSSPDLQLNRKKNTNVEAMFNKILFSLAVVLLVIPVMKSQTCKTYFKCEKERAVNLVKTRCGMMGVYVPQCNKDGRYSLIQCKPSGHCCCADPSTGSLSGCVKSPQKPQCVKDFSNCQFKRAVGLTRNKYCRFIGGYIPQCEKDGSYSSVQSSPNGYSCCAEPECGKQSDCVRAPEVPHCNK
ncbi:equistatin-like [Dendronephthya gigantea]|uniref:equistatin-like n=1 Tax=Dendronephthya gigantea TaxID=151771 RepID=UPI00106AFF10|nr:equistatin-like [Dendronephthya gigantea]